MGEEEPMKNFLFKSLAGAGLLVFSLTTSSAFAQDRDTDSYHSDRDARFQDQHWRGRLFDDVRDDVQHVQTVTWPGGGDNYRLDTTVQELNELQGKLANHVYDESDLDAVIGTLSRVVSDNRMAPRDREMLTDDLSRLRDYRAHHADWDR
jgi:hypothetical protein